MNGKNEKRRIAILGCGSIGQRHIRHLLALEAGPILVYDPDAYNLEETGSDFDVETADQLDHVWQWQPEVAWIAAPTQVHVELALQAARQGCHLFIEKPLSHELDQVETLCQEVQHRQLVSMVGCNMRFHTGPRTVKDLLNSGCIGRVLSARIQTGSYLPDWRPQQDYRDSYSAHTLYGGAVLDCIHEIDLALWYLGPARLLAGYSKPAQSIGLETDGLAEMILEHQNGTLSNIHLNFIQRDYRRCCQIIGTEGTVDWDMTARKVTVIKNEGRAKMEIPDPADWNLDGMYANQARHFLECLQRRSSTVNPVEQAVETLQIALAVKHEREGVCT
jgi:predicted dehydrogenase